MDKFKNFLISEEQLDEKLILLSNGKKYGQICFLAGGAGSGKGFAASNFMEKEKFKVRDVDEWKKTFLKMANLDPVKLAKQAKAGGKITPERYAEIKDLKMTDPDDLKVFHQWITARGIKDRTLDSLIGNGNASKETLPNIMFDITAKSLNDIGKFMPRLLMAGYNPANIHIVWVLTNYEIALSNNIDPSRGRIVPGDIMLTTHKGAAQTMWEYIKGYGKKLAINGSIHVILNNRENTVFMKDPSKKKKERISDITGKKNDGVIQDFKYLTVKERGKSFKSEKNIQKQLYRWIVDNIPTGDLLKALIDRGNKLEKRKGDL